MKKMARVATAALLLSMCGCSSKTVGACDDCNAKSDIVVVKIHHKVTVFNCCADAFTLSFDKVTEDSRCPTGGYCIWAGTVKINISVGESGDVTELQIEQPKNLPIPNHSFSAKLIELNPYPVIQHPLDTNAYQAKIVVSRQ